MRRALGAGALAAIVAVVVAWVVRWATGAALDPAEPLGRLLLPEAWTTWRGVALAAGTVAHVLGGAVLGVGYAAVFEWVTHRAGPLVGLALAVPHAVVTGLAFAFFPVLRPELFAAEPPGAFLQYGGAGSVVASAVFVLVYGALVGALYRRRGDP
ncbi:MAG TPA: hypothetical protein VFS08_11310 [Gemmatimonadaceae bacterium]|nr:hypothetical protein [Gemmatimonadaceae bacterium]